MQKMWFSMSCFATPKLLKIGFKRTWGPKMLGNDICDLDWWFYVIWNRFLALNRQIFHLRSWKVLRIIINRMSPLIGQNFLNTDLAYLSNSKTILPLVKFWSGHYFNIFFSENPLPRPIWAIFFWCFQGKVHYGLFQKENFQMLRGSKVTVSKFSFLKCSYLIGQCSDFYLQ